MSELKYTKNRYSDIILDPESLPDTEHKFKDALERHMTNWKMEGNYAIWLEIPIRKSELIKVADDAGFRAHHCTEDYIMMTRWIGNQHDIKIPNFGTHIVRVEALLLRDDPKRMGVKQVLVVRERFSNGRRGKDWKLLSGAVEPGEFIDQAVIREVKEEIGLNVRFCTVIGHGNRVSTKFGRNEIFFCCHVVMATREDELNSDNIKLQESELVDAKWMDVREALTEWPSHYKLRGLERRCLLSAIRSKGLIHFVTDDRRGPPHRMVAHFVGVPNPERGWGKNIHFNQFRGN